jgi:hypothetical protein
LEACRLSAQPAVDRERRQNSERREELAQGSPGWIEAIAFKRPQRDPEQSPGSRCYRYDEFRVRASLFHL